MKRKNKPNRTILAVEALEDRFLLSAGVLDTTFNATGSPPGTVTTSISGGSATAYGVAIQTDGKIVAGGVAGSDFAVARYNGNGSLDTSFNGAGTVTTSIGKSSTGYDLALQSDGKIVLGGTSDTSFAVARYTTAGALDKAFGNKGTVTTHLGGNNNSFGNGYAVAIQSDGKIVLAGKWITNGSIDIGLARYETDGNLDDGSKKDITPSDSFGSGGTVITSHTLLAGVGQAWATDLAIDSTGRLVVVGYGYLSSTGNRAPFVARYNADGSLDTSLGGTGILDLTQFQSNVSQTYVALQADGKIVLTWNTDVIRLNADGSLDTASFGPLTGGTHTGYVTLPIVEAGALQLQCDGKIVVAEGPTASDGYEAARLLSDGSLDSSFGSGGIAQAPVGAVIHDLAIQPSNGYIVEAGTLNSDFALARFVGDDPCLKVATAATPTAATQSLAHTVALDPTLLLPSGAGVAPSPLPIVPAAPQAGAGIGSPPSDTLSASHQPATDAVFAAAGQATTDDGGWLFGSLSGRDADRT